MSLGIFHEANDNSIFYFFFFSWARGYVFPSSSMSNLVRKRIYSYFHDHNIETFLSEKQEGGGFSLT